MKVLTKDTYSKVGEPWGYTIYARIDTPDPTEKKDTPATEMGTLKCSIGALKCGTHNI